MFTMANSLETALPTSLLIGASSVLCAVILLLCCAKRKRAHTLHSLKFHSRPNNLTGVTNDTVVLQFMDNTGVWRNNIIVDTAALCMSQQNRTTRAPDFRQNIARLGQTRPEILWGNQIPQLKMPTRIATANSRQRGRTVEDKVSLVEDNDETVQKSFSSSGNQCRRDFLALTRDLPEATSSQKTLAIVKPQRSSEGERSGRHYAKGEDSTIILGGPFGPYDSIKSNNMKDKEEPLYHILEEPPTEKSLSCPTGRSKEPFVHIFPHNTAMAATFSEGRSPHERPPLKAPRDNADDNVNADSTDTLSARIWMDYEEIDDESIGNPGTPGVDYRKASLDGRSVNTEHTSDAQYYSGLPGAVRSASPHLRSSKNESSEGRQLRTDVNRAAESATARFKPWSGCPEKILLLYDTKDRTVVEQGENGTQDMAKFTLDKLYPEVKKIKQNANYRPVVKVPRGGTSELDVSYGDLSSQHARNSPGVGTPVSGVKARVLEAQGSDLISKSQINMNPNNGSDYDHMWKHSAQTRDDPGGGIYSRCLPEEDRVLVVPLDQYSQANKRAGRDHVSGEDLDGGRETVTENSSSQAMIFYDRLERPNFKGAKLKRSA